jgi:hypothetical protein
LIPLALLRTLGVEAPSQRGRPAHVSAASGLVRAGEHLYVIPDDENHLAVFPAHGTGPGRLVRLFGNVLPLEPKKRKRHKPDFESLVRLPPFAGHPHGALLALGSCSKPNRCTGAMLALDARGMLAGDPTPIDLNALREGLMERFGRPNIEGCAVVGTELHLLQRGNKGDRRNARVRLRLDIVTASLRADFEIGLGALAGIEEIDLGDIGGVPLCFSDAVALGDGRLAFTAIAEDTADSYSDGACCGAAVGVLGARGGVEFLGRIDPCVKVEGIDAVAEAGAIRVLLVTDADDAAVPASLFACELRC